MPLPPTVQSHIKYVQIEKNYVFIRENLENKNDTKKEVKPTIGCAIQRWFFLTLKVISFRWGWKEKESNKPVLCLKKNLKEDVFFGWAKEVKHSKWCLSCLSNYPSTHETRIWWGRPPAWHKGLRDELHSLGSCTWTFQNPVEAPDT